MEFFQVSEGFKHQQINPALCQRCDLLSKCLASLLERGFAKRLNSRSQRANRSCHPHIEAFGGFSCESCASPVNVANFIGYSVSREAKGICSKRVGFYDFGSSLKIVVVNRTNQIGLGQVQLVVATVDKYTPGVEQRSHGPVAQDRGTFDPGKKVSGHISG